MKEMNIICYLGGIMILGAYCVGRVTQYATLIE